MSLDTKIEVDASTHSRRAWPGLIETYRAYLPVTATTPVVTLHEGNTPLIPVPTIAAEIGRGVNVYVKYDGLNPTGSFKDRGMTMAITKAKEAGAKAVICAQYWQYIRRRCRLCHAGRHEVLRVDSRWLCCFGQVGASLAVWC